MLLEHSSYNAQLHQLCILEQGYFISLNFLCPICEIQITIPVCQGMQGVNEIMPTIFVTYHLIQSSFSENVYSFPSHLSVTYFICRDTIQEDMASYTHRQVTIQDFPRQGVQQIPAISRYTQDSKFSSLQVFSSCPFCPCLVTGKSSHT